MTRIGAVFNPYNHDPEDFRTAVHAAEAAGLPELWIWEDCFRTSAFAAAASALAWTESLRIGIGIAPMPVRNVAATAMEIATIERLFPGRLLPGVGHGVQSWMAQIGARPASLLTLMREYVPALRGLLAGERLTVEGSYVTLDGVALDLPPHDAPPVYAAAEGPKTLALAGQVADGVILDSDHTVAEVARSVERIHEGRGHGDHPAPPDVVAYVNTAFGDPDEAVRLATAALREPASDAAERVLAGSVDSVASGVRAFAAAGVDDVVLAPPRGADLAAFFRDSVAVGELVA